MEFYTTKMCYAIKFNDKLFDRKTTTPPLLLWYEFYDHQGPAVYDDTQGTSFWG